VQRSFGRQVQCEVGSNCRFALSGADHFRNVKDKEGGGMSWKPTDADHDAAAGEWVIGDRVKARANEIKVPAGRRGIVMGFSSVGGHPLVDFSGSGLVLIRAEHLERDNDAEPGARASGRPGSSGTTRLSSTPRPAPVPVTPPPPLPDWYDRPSQPVADEEGEPASEHLDKGQRR
jgi:hypothetical protein